MSGTDKGSVKPGTILLAIFIAALAVAMFSWAETSIDQLGESSQTQREDALACAGLEIQLVEIGGNETHEEVFFAANRDLDRVHVAFEGPLTNATRTVENLRRGSMESASAPLEDLSTVSFTSDRCEHVFRYER